MKRKTIVDNVTHHKKSRTDSKKRRHEKTIDERIVEYMKQKDLFLTKNQFHVYNMQENSYIPLKAFITCFLSNHNLEDQTSLQAQTVAQELKKSRYVPRTTKQTCKAYFFFPASKHFGN